MELVVDRIAADLIRYNPIAQAMRGADMSHVIAVELEMPDELGGFRLPPGVDARLQTLLDLQDRGQRLSAAERAEAEGLVKLAEWLSLLRLRAQRVGRTRKNRR